MSRLLAAIAIAASFAFVENAQAQTYPSRPVTIVVPFPAGGPTDALARVLAERMKAALGQSVIVENPTGAAGTIGTGRVARAAPDGYTVGGVGGGADVVGTYFQNNTGTRFQFVPYRGAAPMIQDLVAGQIDLTFTQVASALAQVRAGQLKAYGVMAKTRWPAAPDTPTFDEAGVPGLHASFWHGLWAPKGTPKDVIASLHAAIVATLTDPSVQQRLTDLGQGLWPRDKQTPEALAAQQKAEVEKWWPIIKAANIRAE